MKKLFLIIKIILNREKMKGLRINSYNCALFEISKYFFWADNSSDKTVSIHICITLIVYILLLIIIEQLHIYKAFRIQNTPMVNNPLKNNFSMNKWSLTLIADCGGFVNVDTKRSLSFIKTPNYPNGYPEYIRCKWILEAPAEHQVLLTVDFEGERGENGCTDYVEVSKWPQSFHTLVECPCSHVYFVHFCLE